jgi:hypothetical protein
MVIVTAQYREGGKQLAHEAVNVAMNAFRPRFP